MGENDCGEEACCVANYRFEFMRNRVLPAGESGKLTDDASLIDK